MKKIITCLLTFLLIMPCFAITSGAETEDLGYAKPEMLGGTDNLFLSYTFYHTNPASGRRTKEGYKPLVGYYDTDGKLKDIFFDSYLFLPCVTTAPSGGSIYRDSANPSNFSDWQLYIDDCFADGFNIPALNEAVGEVKAQLGAGYEDFKANVFLTVLYPTQSQTNFGDVDGDGNTENFNNLEDREKAIKWIIDTQLARFKNGNYSNLNLVGFYWFEENVTSDSQENPMLTYMNKYVHDLNYKTIWIPYYLASGYNKWKTMGFDVACYQPNYMFNKTATSSRVTNVCNTAKSLGMGVEIESSGSIFSSVTYYNRYIDYLKLCTQAGANAGIKMYYNDAVDGVIYTAYKSKVPEIRRIYDYTYKYASQTLNPDELIYLEDVNNYKSYDIISRGCKYTTTQPYTNTSAGYGKISGKEMTDGIFATSDYDTEWVGFNISNKESDGCYHIDIDLFATYDKLSLFSVELGDVAGAGISLPKSVEYFISDNGTDYTSVGYGEIKTVSFSCTLATLKLDMPVKGRYVRAKLEPGALPFVFVSEMSVGVPAGTVPPALQVVDGSPIVVENDYKICALLGEKMTPAGISSMFSQTVSFKNADGSDVGSFEGLGTGCTVSYFYDGKQAGIYDILVFGDLNGDSEINSFDYLLSKKAYLGNYSLNEIQTIAADVNLDGSIDSTDILIIKKHIIGTANIFG